MKYLILVSIALSLTGCASLQNAGNADYSLRQITDENGKAGFDIRVRNGKEIASVKVHLEKKGEDFTIDLEEQGVAAFDGQKTAMQASKIALEQTEKAAAAVALSVAAPAALPVIGSMLTSGGVGAGLLGAGVGAAGTVAAQKALSKPDPAPAVP